MEFTQAHIHTFAVLVTAKTKYHTRLKQLHSHCAASDLGLHCCIFQTIRTLVICGFSVLGSLYIGYYGNCLVLHGFCLAVISVCHQLHIQ